MVIKPYKWKHMGEKQSLMSDIISFHFVYKYKLSLILFPTMDFWEQYCIKHEHQDGICDKKYISGKHINDSMVIENLMSVTSVYIPKLHTEINYVAW